MKKIVFIALSLAAAFAFTSVATAAAPSGNVVSNGKAWRCRGPVNLASVTVTIGKNDPGDDGVHLSSGCTGYIGCYSANDSQAMIHVGAAVNEIPTNVIFDKITADPAGKQDPTGQPLYTYGNGGAYGISNGQSQNSGYTNLTMLSLANRHDIFQGTAAANPIWSYTSLAAGTRSNAT